MLCIDGIGITQPGFDFRDGEACRALVNRRAGARAGNALRRALGLIARTVRITYSRPESPVPPDGERWSQRLRHFDEQLNKPAWEDDPLPSLDDAGCLLGVGQGDPHPETSKDEEE